MIVDEIDSFGRKKKAISLKNRIQSWLEKYSRKRFYFNIMKMVSAEPIDKFLIETFDWANKADFLNNCLDDFTHSRPFYSATALTTAVTPYSY